ncbi:MAG: hypothetical protein MZW92_48030 [Comamonadaceae bacterium]|nr:hypothetical protein [Comamonadaceae bacterium]
MRLLEDEARRRGAKLAYLDTFSFPGAGLLRAPRLRGRGAAGRHVRRHRQVRDGQAPRRRG